MSFVLSMLFMFRLSNRPWDGIRSGMPPLPDCQSFRLRRWHTFHPAQHVEDLAAAAGAQIVREPNADERGVIRTEGALAANDVTARDVGDQSMENHTVD